MGHGERSVEREVGKRESTEKQQLKHIVTELGWIVVFCLRSRKSVGKVNRIT